MSCKSRRYKWLILAIATYSFVALVINLSVFPVVSDDMAREIGLGYAQIGLLMSVFSIFYASVQIPAGVTSDRLGGSKVASVSVLILGLSGLLFAFTPTYDLALVARILMGLSGGFLLPSTMRLLPGWFEAAEYDRAMGIYGSGQGVGLFITLISIPTIASLYGWRTSLALVSALTLLAAASSLALLRDKERTVSNALASMSLRDLKELVTGKLLLLTSFNVTSVSMFTGVLTWMPMFLLKKLDFTLIEVGYATAVMGAVMITASYASGPLSSRIGRAKVILVSMVLCVVTPLLLAYSSSSSEIFVISVLLGMAIMLYFGPTLGAIPEACSGR
jgi:predicted MFS family arabinose efflux permease